MNFELSEEQKGIKALIRSFAKKEVDPKRMQELADKAANAKNVEELKTIMPWDLYEKLHNVGLRQLATPEKYGGGGASWVTRHIAAEEAGYSGGILCRFLSMPWKFCADVADCASPEEQEAFFAEFMANKRLWIAGAISEPGGMSDICLPYDAPGVAMKSYAERDGDDWIINGDKMFCSGGGVAHKIKMAVRTDKKGPVSKSVSEFWITPDMPGVELELNQLIAGDITGNVQIHLDNVRVPEKNRYGKLNGQWPMVESRLAGKTIHFSGLLGATQRLFESARDYAKERIQGGRPIIEHPNIAALLAEAEVTLKATRAFFYQVCWEYDEYQKATGSGVVNPVGGYYCNYLYKKMAARMCEIAAEVYAGMAAVKGMPVESYVRYYYGMQHGGSTPILNLMKCAHYQWVEPWPYE